MTACVCCGATAHLTRDHQVPRCLGGKGGLNLTVRCWRCNHVKASLESMLVRAVRRGRTSVGTARRRLAFEGRAYCESRGHGTGQRCQCRECMTAVLL